MTRIALRGEDLRPATSMLSWPSLSKSFRGLPDLLTLHLRGASIVGKLKFLNNCSKLQDLKLRETSIGGDLQDLQTCTQLQRLELGKKNRNTGRKSRNRRMIIKGDLSSVSNCSKLKVLNLAHTKIEGDLNSLTKLLELEHLNLEKTPIRGHLKTLWNCTNIERLDLSLTRIEGDLQDLQKWKALKELDLCQTRVTGSLEDLNHAAELQILNLSDTGLVGDVAQLAAIKKLRQLDLRNTAVVGELESLQNLKELDFTVVRDYFEGTQVRVKCKQEAALAQVLGTLKPYSDFVDLHHIDGVTWTLVCNLLGRLACKAIEFCLIIFHAFSCIYHLSSLIISIQRIEIHCYKANESNTIPFIRHFFSARNRCRVTRISVDSFHSVGYGHHCWRGGGRLQHPSLSSSFKQLPDLLYLRLDDAPMNGNLDVLENCTKLKVLNLTNSCFRGNLKSLQHLTQLKHLNLKSKRAEITGDLQSLQNCTKLKELTLSPGISGNLKALRHASDLQVLDLAETKMSGDVAELAVARNLSILNLRDTRVAGELYSLRSPANLRMAKVNVSGTDIRGCVQDFALREVLAQLGLKDSELKDLHEINGVTWRLCCNPFFPRVSERRVLLIVEVCYTFSYLHILSSSHLLISS